MLHRGVPIAVVAQRLGLNSNEETRRDSKRLFVALQRTSRLFGALRGSTMLFKALCWRFNTDDTGIHSGFCNPSYYEAGIWGCLWDAKTARTLLTMCWVPGNIERTLWFKGIRNLSHLQVEVRLFGLRMRAKSQPKEHSPLATLLLFP